MYQSVNFAKFLKTSFIIEHLWAAASVGLNKKQCNIPLIIFDNDTTHIPLLYCHLSWKSKSN